MKTQKLAHVSAAEFRARLEAFVVECGSQQEAARMIGVSQPKLHQAILKGDVGRRVPAYFGLRVVRVLVPAANENQGK